MQLQIITPEKIVFDGEVSSVIAPGKDVGFQLLKDHAPIVSSLSVGWVRFVTSSSELQESDDLKKVSGSEWQFQAEGGILEMNQNKIILLAG